MNAKLLTALNAFLLAASWVEIIDVSLRIASGLGALVVAYFAVQAYRSNKKLSDYKLKKEQEEDAAKVEKVKQNGKP